MPQSYMLRKQLKWNEICPDLVNYGLLIYLVFLVWQMYTSWTKKFNKGTFPRDFFKPSVGIVIDYAVHVYRKYVVGMETS